MPACPIAATTDALTLLQSGRAVMAHRVLEGLPALIEAQLVEAHGSAFAEGWDAHLVAPPQRASERKTAPGRSAAPPAPDGRPGGSHRALPTALPNSAGLHRDHTARIAP